LLKIWRVGPLLSPLTPLCVHLCLRVPTLSSLPTFSSLWNMELLFFQARMATQAALEATPTTAMQRMMTDTHEMPSLPPMLVRLPIVVNSHFFRLFDLTDLPDTIYFLRNKYICFMLSVYSSPKRLPLYHTLTKI